jgi:hypothetical protein
MRSRLIAFAIILTSHFSIAQQTAGGVTMPSKTTYTGTNLVLNGVGIREKVWIDLYVAGLYLKSKTKNAKTIISSNEKMVLKLHIVSGLVSSEKMSSSIEESFKVSTGGNTINLRTRIDAFKAIFMKDKITDGVVFDISYIPGKGTAVYTNGKLQGTIKGLDFKKALFNIWLGVIPADEHLKEKLLNN